MLLFLKENNKNFDKGAIIRMLLKNQFYKTLFYKERIHAGVIQKA